MLLRALALTEHHLPNTWIDSLQALFLTLLSAAVSVSHGQTSVYEKSYFCSLRVIDLSTCDLRLALVCRVFNMPSMLIRAEMARTVLTPDLCIVW